MGSNLEIKLSISDFTKEKEAGRGGTGIVYKAIINKDLPLLKAGSVVALKQYWPEALNEPRDRERIAREYTAGTKLAHPNLSRTFYIDVECPDPFIVMEWCGGTNLLEWRKANPNPEEGFLLNFATQILDAIDFMHSSKNFHRDIKPKNIHVDKEGRIKLLDYGFVKPLRNPGITDAGKFLGTQQYAAPEYLLSNEYYYVSDLYSIGGTLFYLLHNREIFDTHKTVDSIKAAKRIHRIPFDLSLKSKGPIWSALMDLCIKLLDPDYKRRPQSASECINILSKSVPNYIPFKVYFAAALTRMSEESRKKYDEIVKYIQQAGDRTGYMIYVPKKYTDPISTPELSSPEVYWIDRERVASSDLLLVYADEPSFGVGQEVEIASNAGIPVGIIYSKGAKISRMLLGAPIKIIGTIVIENEKEIESIVQDFFEANISRLSLSRKAREFEYSLRLGNRVRSIREGQGLSIKKLSEKTEIETELIESLETRPENYSSISVIHIRRLAKALGVVPAELLRDQTDEELDNEGWRLSINKLKEFAEKKQLTYETYRKLKYFGKEKYDIQLQRTSARGNSVVFDLGMWKKLFHDYIENGSMNGITIPLDDDSDKLPI